MNVTISFTQQEQKIIRSLKGLPSEDNPQFVPFLDRAMDKLLSTPPLGAHATYLAIKEKIAKAIYDLQYNQQVEDALKKKTRKSSAYSATKSDSHKRVNNISSRHLKVIDALKLHGPLSRRDIANKAGMFLNSVCARVDELIALGVVTPAGQTKDKETNRTVETVALKEVK